MEAVVAEALKQIPALAALIWLVVAAMRALKARDMAFMEFMKNRDEQFAKVLGHIGDDCHATQDRATQAINKNTEMLGRVDSTLHTVRKELAKGA